MPPPPHMARLVALGHGQREGHLSRWYDTLTLCIVCNYKSTKSKDNIYNQFRFLPMIWAQWVIASNLIEILIGDEHVGYS